MPLPKFPHPAEFRRQVRELVHAGRDMLTKATAWFVRVTDQRPVGRVQTSSITTSSG